MKSKFARTAVVVALSVGVGLPPTAAFASGDSRVGIQLDLESHSSHSKKTYAQRLAAYRSAIELINQAFATSVRNAQQTFVSQMRLAVSAIDKVDARAQFRIALNGATAAREHALEELGDPPTR